MGPAGLLACERTLRGHKRLILRGHKRFVWSLTGWEGKVASGSEDRSVRVWDTGTGAHDATLPGRCGTVLALAGHGGRLFGASRECAIRLWELRGAWAALRTVQAYGRRARQHPLSLAVSGSQLVSGSAGVAWEARAWDLATLELQHTLPQPAGPAFAVAPAVDGGCVGAVGCGGGGVGGDGERGGGVGSCVEEEAWQQARGIEAGEHDWRVVPFATLEHMRAVGTHYGPTRMHWAYTAMPSEG